ncbi:helix-turn-helix transcriptional regulator [Oscillatoria salina]|uniref:helix-turn-helix transcriptional regulator n=1 Tax=Oscillatoria salina TaxID=331517 RepID=UPI0013BDD8C7|nr:AraC family transcriptional regulator [Oscillatoria salina]MBZ8182856.1 helix-turn-helix transcriptional regulator [Oscillatoria salina IIICB1]NET86958.1 helix-turn-helix transcriptional regulator [Kamptonema sp. SIO1D9]
MAIELIFPPQAMQQGFPKLLEQMNQSSLYSYEIEGIEARLEWSKMVGQGSVRFAYLRPGLQISIENHQMKEKLVMQGQHSHLDPWKFYFLVSGELSGVVDRSASPFTLKTGENCLTACSGDRAQMTYYDHQTYLAVTILVDPWFLKTFLEEQSGLPQPLQQAMKTSAERFFHTGATSPAMQIALHQILYCPYEGFLRQIYIESKALELIVLKLAQIDEQISPPKHNVTLQPQDIDCIHNAKDILLSNIESPPSLLELAKKAGTNDYKLKIGFRQLFGTTVFGYLRNQRMEQARQLLLEKQMNVSEVAQTVGYSSLSRFSTAFKNYFGITPKTYQKNS